MLTRRGKTLAMVLSAFTFLMLFGTALFSSPAGCFRRNVLFPAPGSVSNIQVSANNQFFWIAPEPVVHIRFSASPDDIQTILTKRHGEPYDGFIPALNFGPTWFRPATSTNGLRQFRLDGDRQFLWIDETGTNAFFYLFQI